MCVCLRIVRVVIDKRTLRSGVDGTGAVNESSHCSTSDVVDEHVHQIGMKVRMKLVLDIKGDQCPIVLDRLEAPLGLEVFEHLRVQRIDSNTMRWVEVNDGTILFGHQVWYAHNHVGLHHLIGLTDNIRFDAVGQKLRISIDIDHNVVQLLRCESVPKVRGIDISCRQFNKQ